ncbi:hypothetical protein GCM10010145_53940 [Streptomyces ruber]|uniref:Lipoprotein n=2 Tax=Streptomyces TaxID=1883 RepID=A0A918EV81_9ACTN|nr:hypothetical protein [Streptomyces ruber]GGQ77418.1 hypothetical protein GCM10010145_53940 [Streptomyces ruber]
MRHIALAAAVLPAACLLAVTACTATTPTSRPAPDDLVKAATQRLTDACLADRGFVPPRPGRSPLPAAEQRRVADALFGAGRAELSLRLPTGYVVRAHTDGCLAAAQRRLYGDQRRWFRASVTVGNLRPEAARTHRTLAEVRAAHRTELADWGRMRARAVRAAGPLLAK